MSEEESALKYTAKDHFILFREDLEKCVDWLKGKSNPFSGGKLETFKKKIRKVAARYFGVPFSSIGNIHVVRDIDNVLVKLDYEGEQLTLIRLHINELKESPE